MNLDTARQVANEIVTVLAPACKRIEIAGSIRRLKPEPKDVEIVFIPRTQDVQIDLFGGCETISLVDDVLNNLMDAGKLRPDQATKRWGPKYKRLIHVASQIVIELFAAEADNWGYILALRTGPADFNHMLVTPRWQGGMLPPYLTLASGYVMRTENQEIIRVTSEMSFFDMLGIPCWPPEERSAERLKEWMGR